MTVMGALGSATSAVGGGKGHNLRLIGAARQFLYLPDEGLQLVK